MPSFESILSCCALHIRQILHLSASHKFCRCQSGHACPSHCRLWASLNADGIPIFRSVVQVSKMKNINLLHPKVLRALRWFSRRVAGCSSARPLLALVNVSRSVRRDESTADPFRSVRRFQMLTCQITLHLTVILAHCESVSNGKACVGMDACEASRETPYACACLPCKPLNALTRFTWPG